MQNNHPITKQEKIAPKSRITIVLLPITGFFIFVSFTMGLVLLLLLVALSHAQVTDSGTFSQVFPFVKAYPDLAVPSQVTALNQVEKRVWKHFFSLSFPNPLFFFFLSLSEKLCVVFKLCLAALK
jgi:hypothetical protein